MAETAVIEDQLRASIIARPDVILQDPDVMRALVNADGQAQGANVIDLRSVAMDRLEQRLDRLESAHRSVLAAAYDNLSGTQQIQRAILRMLEPQDFEEFVQTLSGDVADVLRVDGMRLLLETEQTEDELSLTAMGDGMNLASRLQGLAREGQIVIGPNCRRRLENYRRNNLATELPFTITEGGNAPLKGYDNPVFYYLVSRGPDES